MYIVQTDKNVSLNFHEKTGFQYLSFALRKLLWLEWIPPLQGKVKTVNIDTWHEKQYEVIIIHKTAKTCLVFFFFDSGTIISAKAYPMAFIQHLMRDRDRSTVEGHFSTRRDAQNKLFTSVPTMISSMQSNSHNLFHKMSNTSLCRGVLEPQNHSWNRYACYSAVEMHISRNVFKCPSLLPLTQILPRFFAQNLFCSGFAIVYIAVKR